MEPRVAERRPNRLIGEKSPYLRQHAHNLVDWYPWGEEAFRRALDLDRPIFLSIGYSACHWCHVMEEESFEDEEIARLLNDSFVPVKVDREERPDVDSMYMIAAQMLFGSGGWPLTVVLTPGLKPFFAATYLPKENKGGMTGLTTILPAIAQLWKERKKEVEESSDKVIEAIREGLGSTAGFSLGEENLMTAFQNLMRAFDERITALDGLPSSQPAPLDLPAEILEPYRGPQGVSMSTDLGRHEARRAFTTSSEGVPSPTDQIGWSPLRCCTTKRSWPLHIRGMAGLGKDEHADCAGCSGMCWTA